jgi:hypothetical protein
MKRLPRPVSPRTERPRGAALLIVIVAVGVFAGICQSLLMALVHQHRRLDHESIQAQARWVAESALFRAVTQLRKDPGWSGETWEPFLAGWTCKATTTVTPGDVSGAAGYRVVVRSELSREGGDVRTIVRTYSGDFRAPTDE